MKTFKDLVFKNHPAGSGTHAQMNFRNNYGVSVVTGGMFYTSKDKPYEVAVTQGSELCYTTPITDNVLGWNTSDEVTEIMRKVQRL